MRRFVPVAVVLAALSFAGVAAAVPTAGATTAPTVYYLALGDSLSTGGGADPGQGYVNDIENQVAPLIPGLTLVDLGCGGDSTTRMIHGGLCHNYQTGNQLGDAEQFLQSHPGQVAFVTIDVGGDDIVGCALSGAVNPTCVASGLAAVQNNMPTILSGLRSAGGAVPIVGMNYYDPILAAWYSGAWYGGSPSQSLARQSLGVLHSLNNELKSAYAQYGVPVANVQKSYASGDWAMTGSYMGTTLPQNVANICNWTHMCIPTGANIHATDYGHSLIAGDYEQKLRVPATISGVPPNGSVGAPYSFQYTVGGYPSATVTRVGPLPPGLSLSTTGLLSGTPTRSGTYAVEARAHDSAGSATDDQSVTIS
jgi:lysophospholipase L1-like esterase